MLASKTSLCLVSKKIMFIFVFSGKKTTFSCILNPIFNLFRSAKTIQSPKNVQENQPKKFGSRTPKAFFYKKTCFFFKKNMFFWIRLKQAASYAMIPRFLVPCALCPFSFTIAKKGIEKFRSWLVHITKSVRIGPPFNPESRPGELLGGRPPP